MQAMLEPLVRRFAAEIEALAAQAAIATRETESRWTELREAVDDVVDRLTGGRSGSPGWSSADGALAAVRGEVAEMRTAAVARAQQHKEEIEARVGFGHPAGRRRTGAAPGDRALGARAWNSPPLGGY